MSCASASAPCLRGTASGRVTTRSAPYVPLFQSRPLGYVLTYRARVVLKKHCIAASPMLASVDALTTARIPPRPRSTERLLLLHLPRAVQLGSLDHVLGRHIRATRGSPVHLSSSWASMPFRGCTRARSIQDHISTPSAMAWASTRARSIASMLRSRGSQTASIYLRRDSNCGRVDLSSLICAPASAPL